MLLEIADTRLTREQGHYLPQNPGLGSPGHVLLIVRPRLDQGHIVGSIQVGMNCDTLTAIVRTCVGLSLISVTMSSIASDLTFPSTKTSTAFSYCLLLEQTPGS